jgi:hypothetical protein
MLLDVYGTEGFRVREKIGDNWPNLLLGRWLEGIAFQKC